MFMVHRGHNNTASHEKAIILNLRIGVKGTNIGYCIPTQDKALMGPYIQS